jgi:hypothetical protein
MTIGRKRRTKAREFLVLLDIRGRYYVTPRGRTAATRCSSASTEPSLGMNIRSFGTYSPVQLASRISAQSFARTAYLL